MNKYMFTDTEQIVTEDVLRRMHKLPWNEGKPFDEWLDDRLATEELELIDDDEDEAEIGDFIEIIELKDEEGYEHRTGWVTHIDALGQLHGTWGGLAIIPSEDKFKIYKEVKHDN